MKRLKIFALAAVAGMCLAVCAPKAQAQISVNIGVAPVCPYGYFNYPPYPCAPYGYYGPEWFVGGVFIGAGPWFHGPANFHGYVNNHYDPRHGYKGALPQHGARPTAGRQPGHVSHFNGNEQRDGRGHATPAKGKH